jgi:surface protein
MKIIKDYIYEALKINSKSKVNTYKYFPKNKRELIKIINKLINERGVNADLNDIDTSKIKNMEMLFIYSEFNGDISDWDVSNVRDMYAMFYDSNFSGDISNWNINKVKNMEDMFIGCPLEKNPPKWYHK